MDDDFDLDGLLDDVLNSTIQQNEAEDASSSQMEAHHLNSGPAIFKVPGTTNITYVNGKRMGKGDRS